MTIWLTVLFGHTMRTKRIRRRRKKKRKATTTTHAEDDDEEVVRMHVMWLRVCVCVCIKFDQKMISAQYYIHPIFNTYTKMDIAAHRQGREIASERVRERRSLSQKQKKLYKFSNESHWTHAQRGTESLRVWWRIQTKQVLIIYVIVNMCVCCVCVCLAVREASTDASKFEYTIHYRRRHRHRHHYRRMCELMNESVGTWYAIVSFSMQQ